MPKPDLSKFQIEQELEKLSWEFMIAEKKLEEEKEGMESFLEEDPKEEELEENYNSAREELREDYYSAVDSLYSNKESNINNFGRSSGIIFDESKLEDYKVSEWNKAPRLRESKVKKSLLSLLMIVFTPFRFLFLGFYYFFKSVYKTIFFFVNFFYKLFKNIIITFWQIVMAFKHSFIYLFGDLSLAGRDREEPSPREKRFKFKKSQRVFPFVAIRMPAKLKPVATFVLIAALLVLPLEGYILYNKTQNIKGEVLGASESGLENLRQAGVLSKSFNFSGAASYFASAENNFSNANDSINSLGGLANSVGSLVPDVSTGKKLLNIAEESAQIGTHLSKVADVWNQILGQVGTSDELNPGVKQTINWQGAESEFSLALAKARKVGQELEGIDLSNTQFREYENEFRTLQQEFPTILSYLEESKDLFDILYYLLGADEPSRLMLIFQNNSEMRPTGGFMGSYAIVDIDNGSIKNITVPGGGFYDLKGSLSVSVDAPYPFHLFSSIWQPWNANWFPDYPASAEKVSWFYGKSGGSSIDAVISFTPNVLEKLLAITGEIEMPEYDTVVNSENFVKMAQVEVEVDYDKEENQPKKFIGDLMPKVLEKVFALKDSSLVDLWQVVSSSLSEKHLLIYLDDEELQKKVMKFGWAGEVLQTDGDYLSVISTNIAGGKTDRVISSRVYHKAELNAAGEIINTVTLVKEHNGNTEDIFENQTNTDYIRFYVPAGSELISAVGFDPMPTDRIFQESGEEIMSDPDLETYEQNLRIDKNTDTRITDEFGKTVFANWLSVAPGESKTITLKYKLPFTINLEEEQDDTTLWQLIKQYFTGDREEETKQKTTYSLLLQKQSGNNNLTVYSKFISNSDWNIKDYLSTSDSFSYESDFSSFTSPLKTDEYYGLILEEK